MEKNCEVFVGSPGRARRVSQLLAERGIEFDEVVENGHAFFFVPRCHLGQASFVVALAMNEEEVGR